MLDLSPHSLRTRFESAPADSRGIPTYNSQNRDARQHRDARWNIVHLSLSTGDSPFLDDTLEHSDLQLEDSISDSIEAVKLQHHGEKLREIITQYSGKQQGALQPKNQLFSAYKERVQRDALIQYAAEYVAINLAIKAIDSLKEREEHFASLQMNLVHISWYDQACQDLSEASIEALEEGFEAPEPATIEYTRIILRRLSEEYDQLPDIEPMSDRSIAICFENRERDSRILIIVESDRGGLLVARIDGSSYQTRVPDVLEVLQLGGYHALDKAGIRRSQGHLADA